MDLRPTCYPTLQPAARSIWARTQGWADALTMYVAGVGTVRLPRLQVAEPDGSPPDPRPALGAELGIRQELGSAVGAVLRTGRGWGRTVLRVGAGRWRRCWCRRGC